MNMKCGVRFFILCLTLLVMAKAQASMMGDIDVSRVHEDCGKWQISFNWSEMDEYKSSISHGDSTSDKQKIATDTLTLTSLDKKPKVLKVTIIAYSYSQTNSVEYSQMTTLANETLKKSDVCKEIRIAQRMIEGRTGIFASGLTCPLEEPVLVAVYPLDYHIDGKGGVLVSNAIGIILSTYNQEIMNRLINSIKIEQMK